MAEAATTRWGRLMRVTGQVLTVVGILRLLVGMWHVIDHGRMQLLLARSRRGEPYFLPVGAAGLDDVYSVGALASGGGTTAAVADAARQGAEAVAATATAAAVAATAGGDGGGDAAAAAAAAAAADGGARADTAGGGAAANAGAGGAGGGGRSQQGDLVTTSLSFLLVHLKIDGTAWAPLLSTVFVGSMALLHVRAFLVAMQQLARFGILSTSTELYSLSLALLAGFYFMACVWQLSFQLPLRCRRGVTAALGDTTPFELCFLLFDAVFVVSTVVFAVLLWVDYRKKSRLSRNVLVADSWMLP